MDIYLYNKSNSSKSFLVQLRMINSLVTSKYSYINKKIEINLFKLGWEFMLINFGIKEIALYELHLFSYEFVFCIVSDIIHFI